MKILAIYWIVGCVLIGVGAGMREASCPNDPYPPAQEYFFAVATWPGGLAWAVTNNKVPACKVAS